MSTKEEKKEVLEEPGWKKIGLKIVLPILICLVVFLVSLVIIMIDSGDLWPQFTEDYFFPTAAVKNKKKFYLIATMLALLYGGFSGGVTYGIAQKF